MSENNGSPIDGGNPPADGGQGTPPVSDKWYSSVQDADLRGLAELKGWDTPEKAITGYRNLEKHMGLPPERLAKVPDKDDAAGWSEFNKRFGWDAPATSEEYGFKAPDGADGSLLGPIADLMRETGIPKEKATKLVEGWFSMQGEASKNADLQLQSANERELAELRSEWGANAEELLQLGQRAESEFAKKAGIDDAHLELMKDAMGPKLFHKLWAEIGSKIGEAKFVDGKVETHAAMTPEAAQARLNQLGADKAWFARYEGGDITARQEFARLRDIVARASIR